MTQKNGAGGRSYEIDFIGKKSLKLLIISSLLLPF